MATSRAFFGLQTREKEVEAGRLVVVSGLSLEHDGYDGGWSI